MSTITVNFVRFETYHLLFRLIRLWWIKPQVAHRKCPWGKYMEIFEK